MIEVEGTEKVYCANKEIGNEILSYLKNNNFWNANQCTQEVVQKLVELLSSFALQVEKDSVPVTIRKHETEAEAREYFGPEFIHKFDELLKKVDSEESVLAIHGTSLDSAPKIIDQGLYYKDPALLSTACIQDRSLDGYKSYETLLNWPHREYKGLVLLAIPYECFYKEPLWEKVSDDNNALWRYKIKPEYIVGYVDVLEKKIVSNPSYKQNHNYEGLDYDLDVFHKRDITNKEFYEMSTASLETDVVESTSINEDNEEYMGVFGTYHEDNALENVSNITAGLEGIINRAFLSDSGRMSEIVYQSIMGDVKIAIEYLGKDLPKLKTAEEAKRDELEETQKWQNMPQATDEELKEWGLFWDDEKEENTKTR